MKLVFNPLNESEIYDLISWQYASPYDIYNAGVEFMTAEEMKEAVAYYLNPANAFQSISDEESGDFVAFCSFGPDGQVPDGEYHQEALDIGLGVRPQLVGRGLGDQFVRATIHFAISTFQPTCLRVTIADFNKRACRVWMKNGFQRQHSFETANGMPFSIYYFPVDTPADHHE